MSPSQKRVAFFVTCLVDQLMPEIGVAAVRLLRRAGYEVDFPPEQVCCGQPFSNSGFRKEARRIARHTIEVFEDCETVVMPSGSCAAMLRIEYAHLFEDEPAWKKRAGRLGAKTFELGEFLIKRAGFAPLPVPDAPRVTYHDSCHAKRMIGLGPESRLLLEAVGCDLLEMEPPDRCCGFGGIFCIKMPEVSNAMTAEKLRCAAATGADVLVTIDPGCLMQMRGMAANGVPSTPRIEHLAVVMDELLAGDKT